MSSPPPSPVPNGTTTGCPAAGLVAWPQALATRLACVLLGLVLVTVGVCGAVFYTAARAMLRTQATAHVAQLAYSVAGALDDLSPTDQLALGHRLNYVGRSGSVAFAVLAAPDGQTLARAVNDDACWQAYQKRLAAYSDAAPAGQPAMMQLAGRTCYAVAVPVIQTVGPAAGSLLGYVHLGISDVEVAQQQRYLKGSVLLTCLGVVLLAIPLAVWLARYLTVPLRRLVAAADALKSGDLAHRVARGRSDEFGVLVDAFNDMADEMQRQRAAISQSRDALEKAVEERTAELQRVNQRLRSEMDDKNDFLRAVSHDLNAPLRNIQGMAQMLLMKYQASLQEDAVQRLQRIQKNVEAECTLINELLELSRIKARRETIEPVDLHAMVCELQGQFASDIERGRVNFRLLAHLPAVRGERNRLRQVFQNLIDNALKYMRPDGRREIAISVTPGRGEVVISVCDTGIGVAAEDLPQLFHVFRRAKSALTAKIPGKGVGLASVKSIVENHEGRLWAESRLGEGTTIHVAFPASAVVEEPIIANA